MSNVRPDLSRNNRAWGAVRIPRGMYSVLSVVLSLAFLPAMVHAQVDRIAIDLSNAFSVVDQAGEGRQAHLQSYNQLYTLRLSGHAIDPRFLMFGLKTGLRDDRVRSTSQMASSNVHQQNVELYDVSLDMFAETSFPMSFYALRSKNSVETEWRALASSQSQASGYLNDSKGMTLNLTGNGYWPYIQANLERRFVEGNSPSQPFDTRSDLVRFTLSNDSERDRSSYRLTFHSTASEYTRNEYSKQANYDMLIYRPPERETYVSASTQSDIWDDVRFNSEFVFDQRDRIQSQQVRGSFRYQTGEAWRHRDVASHVVLRTPGARTDIFHLTHTADISGGGESRGSLTAQYTTDRSDVRGRTSGYERGTATGEIHQVFEVGSAGRVQASAEASIGVVQFVDERLQTVHGLRGRAVYDLPVNDRLSLRFIEDAGQRRDVGIGTIAENSAEVSARVVAPLSTLLEADVGRADRFYSNAPVAPHWRSIAAGLRSTTYVSQRTTFSADVRRELRRWFNTDISHSVGVTVQSTGLIRDLTASVQGRMSHSSYADVRILRLLVQLQYQFYAYAITGRYVLDDYAGWRSNGLFLEIRRPFMFDLQ